MSSESHDPREIPILTETIEAGAEAASTPFDFEAAHAAILAEALQSAEALLRRAAREIDAKRFESLFERLRTELPELVDRVMREQSAIAVGPEEVRD
jgi:Zn-dependent M32 family carboxypeptidase